MAGLTVLRIGLFGGTFDPPHLGHTILAEEALCELKLERVLWILTPQSPLKDGREISPLDHRLTLVRAALQDTPEFELSQVDILRSPPYYAVDTVRILQKEFPGAELIYLMGGDSLEDLPQWHKPQEFVQEIAGLGIYKRPGAEPDLKSLDKQFPGLGDKTTFFHSPRIEISAADIRRRIHERRPYRFFLLPAVYQVIQSHQYYW